MYEARDSVYCYPGTNTLVNKLNIRDANKLDNYEKSMVALKLMALEKKGITGNFDVAHFVGIHKFLFEDIYPYPFREGNGRTTREFIRQIALKYNYNLNLQNFTAQEILDASIKSIVDTKDLEDIVNKCLEHK